MHRIDGPGHIGNLFSEGNPATGLRATKVTAEWLNDFQENLLHVLQMSAIAPVKGEEDQLYLAIVALINAAVAGLVGGGPAPVPITRMVNSLGLLVGGGALAADLSLNVPKATGPEIAAGTDDTKAITPAGLFASVAASFGANGYIKLPGGLIVQWGVATAILRTTTNVTLPLTFPHACLFAGCEGAMMDTDEDNNPTVTGRGLSTVSVFSMRRANVAVNFLAIGY